jgi:hypothetical protein
MEGIAFVLFLVVLAVVDRSLARWGSVAIRSKPRPGGRVTILFLGVCAACGLLELLALRLSASAVAVAVVVALLQLPFGVIVALGLDRVLPAAEAAGHRA